MQRLAMVAKLKEGAAERAAELVRGGPPFDPGERGFGRHSVYLGPGHVIFVFESDSPDAVVGELIDERARSAAFAQWAGLLDGPPEVAVERYHWRRTG